MDIGDVNGDGYVDIVTCNQTADSVSVLLGNGDGTFQTPVSYSSGGASAGPVAIGDVNGDGHPDLAVVNEYLSEFDRSAGNVSVLLNNGDGTFQPPVSYPVGYGPGSVAIGDLNGDGHPDLVVANQSLNGYGAVGVLLGNGDGTFQNPVNYTSGGVWADAVAIGDLNGDGNPDLAVTNMCAIGGTGKCLRPTVFVLPGSGDGTFVGQYTARSLGGYDPQSIAIADVNGDGKPDLVVANFAAYGNHAHGSVGVLLNDLAAKTLTNLTSSLNPSQVNQPVTFTATITSALPIPDGEVVAFYDGATELGTDSTTNGVATLTTSFSKAGGHTIKATYPGDAFHKGSSGKARQVVKR
jgi:hypothetical protein